MDTEIEREIEDAQRCLDMIRYLLKDRKLSNVKRLKPYLQGLFLTVSAIQERFMPDDEYARLFTNAVKELNSAREHELRVTHKDDGSAVFDINALLPLKEMRPKFMMTGECNAITIQDGNGGYRAAEEDAARRYSDKPKTSGGTGKQKQDHAMGGVRSGDDARSEASRVYANRIDRAA